MSKYANMRYKAIYRTSSDLQTEKSIPQQKMIVQQYADKHGMIPAGGDLEQGGISSTKRKIREDIDELIEHKRKYDDFDVILVHDYSRLTRRGTKDAFAIEQRLNEEGIKVLSATEEIPDGPYADVIKTVLHTQHQAYVREGSNRTVRGQGHSIHSGKSVGTTHTPFGIDRLYLSQDGTPRFYLRNLADGSRVRVSVKTGEVLSTYERRDHGEGNSQIYKKQMDEIVTFVPGDPKKLDAVRKIFRMALIEGVGPWTIAKTLNEDGIPSPHGNKWNKSSVRRLMISPVYTGRMIFNRVSEAEFFCRSKNGPVAITEEQLKKGALRQRFRPPCDWDTVDLPSTKDILDPDLRDMAIAFQDAAHRKDASRRGLGLQRDKHSKSSFILKDVLRLKLDGHLMNGSVANQTKYNQKVYRYYKPHKFGSVSKQGTIYNCLLPAQPIEGFVLDLLARLFRAAPELRPQIVEFVKQQQALLLDAKTKLNDLERQRASLMKKISAFLDVADFDDVMVQKVADMRARLRDLDIKIGVAKEKAPDGDVEAIAESVLASLRQMSDAMSAASPMTLRKMISVLVTRMEADPQTREVWLEMALPSWAVDKVGRIGVNKFCLGSGCLPSTDPEAKNQLSADAESRPNQLLFAKAHLICKRQGPNTRISQKLENFECTITDGLLAEHGQYRPTEMTLNGHTAAILDDAFGLMARKGQKTDGNRLGGNLRLQFAIPLPPDAMNEETGPRFTPFEFWTPGAIAA